LFVVYILNIVYFMFLLVNKHYVCKYPFVMHDLAFLLLHEMNLFTMKNIKINISEINKKWMKKGKIKSVKDIYEHLGGIFGKFWGIHIKIRNNIKIDLVQIVWLAWPNNKRIVSPTIVERFSHSGYSYSFTPTNQSYCSLDILVFELT
jgi:hypothetical protein